MAHLVIASALDLCHWERVWGSSLVLLHTFYHCVCTRTEWVRPTILSIIIVQVAWGNGHNTEKIIYTLSLCNKEWKKIARLPQLTNHNCFFPNITDRQTKTRTIGLQEIIYDHNRLCIVYWWLHFDRTNN